MLRLPKPSLRSRMEQMKQELRLRLRTIKCRRALERSIAAMERDAHIEDCIIWEEKK